MLYRFYFLTRDLNISIEIFKYELLQVKYLFLQSQETLKQNPELNFVRWTEQSITTTIDGEK